MANQSVTPSEGVAVRTAADHIASTAYWLKASQGRKGRSDVKAKCRDLFEAYTSRYLFLTKLTREMPT